MVLSGRQALVLGTAVHAASGNSDHRTKDTTNCDDELAAPKWLRLSVAVLEL